MKAVFFTIVFFLLTAFVNAQSLDKISRKCPSPNGTSYGAILVQGNGDIVHTPCPNRPSFFNGNLKLLDATFSPFFSNPTSVNYFSIGTATRFSVPSNKDFFGAAYSFPLTISGTGGFYTGQQNSLNIQGTVTNPTIVGNYTTIFTNSLFPSGTGTIYGSFTSADIGGQVNQAYGGYFSVLSGGSGASGVNTLTAVAGVVGMAHNGNTTNAFGGDFLLNSSASSPSLVTTAAAVRARTTLQAGVTATNLRGIALTDWVINGGTATNSYGIFADQSIDIGSSKSYFIFSTSQSQSLFSANVYIARTPGNSNGLILQSPDGSCYKFTVANGGALSAGSLVTCP